MQNIYSNFLFFDIETTGLSRTRSHLYMIGCGWLESAADKAALPLKPETETPATADTAANKAAPARSSVAETSGIADSAADKTAPARSSAAETSGIADSAADKTAPARSSAAEISGIAGSAADKTSASPGRKVPSSQRNRASDDYLLKIRQWMVEKPSEEKDVLILFSRFLEQFRKRCREFRNTSPEIPRTDFRNAGPEIPQAGAVPILVHYNGSSFDIPYLNVRYQFYHLDDPFSSNILQSQLDLYRAIRPFSPLLGLSSCRQKDVERMLGIYRKDPFTGGELIEVYRKYLQTADPKLQDTLLLHNREDVQALAPLLSVAAYRSCFDGNFRITGIALPDPSMPDSSSEDANRDELEIRAECRLPVPVPLASEKRSCRIRLSGNHLVLGIRVFTGELRYYFSDYRNYYYLPLEDTAVHKSVGSFVDPKYRRRAKAAEAYQRVDGTFLPVGRSAEGRKYYASYKSDPPYLLVKDLDPDFRNPFWKKVSLDALALFLAGR